MQTYGKRRGWLYVPGSTEPFRISRSKIDLFLECPRCFYLDRRFGVGRPQGPSFTLNSAVDTLLKKEFDIHRAKGESHPLLAQYGLDLVPYRHDKLDEWRHNFTGISYLHQPTNMLVFGAVDDVWVDKNGSLTIVDYKSTSTEKEISLDDEYKQGYKRQLEIYQWLFRQNGFEVSDTGYFVYCNGKVNREAFDGRLEFDIQLIDYRGSDGWVEEAIYGAYKCLNSTRLPESSMGCGHCDYRRSSSKIEAGRTVQTGLFEER